MKLIKKFELKAGKEVKTEKQNCAQERKWVRVIKDGLDKEKKGTKKKSGGRRSERGKSKGATFFSWRAHVNE